MSVLIRGMEMPKEGSWVTLRVFPDGQCFLYSWCGNDFDFMEHLTAVPVPPHGDLIDASEKIRVQMYDDEHEDFHTVEMTIDDLLSQSWVKAYAFPIIPASGEGE